jgi:hypothetical protein
MIHGNTLTFVGGRKLMKNRGKPAVFSEIHIQHIISLWGQNVDLLNVKLVVHIVTTALYYVKYSVVKTSQLMLYREIIAVCSQIHTKHINTLCGHNVELLNVKPGGIHSDQWVLKG